MDKKIRFKGYLTFDDSLKLQRTIKPRPLVPPAAIVTVLTMGAVALVLWKMGVDMPMAALMLIFLGGFMAGGFWLMNNSARKTQARLYRKACIKRRGTLEANAIQIKKGQTRKTIPWELFDHTIEIDGIIAIVKGGESLGFARYMFPSDDAWSRARSLIKDRYP